MDFAPFRFFFTEKSIICSVIPPFSQKGTLGSPVRLQARLLTAHCRCHLFTSVPAALKPLILLHFSLSPVKTLRPHQSKLFIACSDFLMKNQSLLMPLVFLFCKNDTHGSPIRLQTQSCRCLFFGLYFRH